MNLVMLKVIRIKTKKHWIMIWVHKSGINKKTVYLFKRWFLYCTGVIFFFILLRKEYNKYIINLYFKN